MCYRIPYVTRVGGAAAPPTINRIKLTTLTYDQTYSPLGQLDIGTIEIRMYTCCLP